MTEIEANKVFAALCSLFPSAKIEPWERRGEGGAMQPIPGGGTRGAYARMLADLEYTPACAAVERVAATHRFPAVLPAIAEIRDSYAELMRGPVRAGGEAWGDVVALHSPTRARPGCSVYRHPREHEVEPLVWRCIQAIGWVALCDSENSTADRARFIELYDRLAKTERRDDVTKTLPAATRLRAQLAQGTVAELAGALKSNDLEVRRALKAGGS